MKCSEPKENARHVAYADTLQSSTWEGEKGSSFTGVLLKGEYKLDSILHSIYWPELLLLFYILQLLTITWSSRSSSASLLRPLRLRIGGVEERLLGWCSSFTSMDEWCHASGSTCSTLMGLTCPCRGRGATPRLWYCCSQSRSLRYLELIQLSKSNLSLTLYLLQRRK